MEEDVWNKENVWSDKVREASSVWLLMGKGYRISRSIRLQWFFQYLNKIISPKSQEEIVSSFYIGVLLFFISFEEQYLKWIDFCVNKILCGLNFANRPLFRLNFFIFLGFSRKLRF